MLGVRERLQPPSMSMRSCGHPPAMADSAVERSFVQLCKLKICRSNHRQVTREQQTNQASHGLHVQGKTVP